MRAEITSDEVAAMARVVGVPLKGENTKAIADMLTAIHAGVLDEAAKVPQDAAICLSFDAR